MRCEFDLVLGLPHTNHRGLAEHLLMMQAGHFQWNAIAAAVGAPLSTLRTSGGGEVYAAFYYIETRFPPGRSIDMYKLDDKLRFVVQLRSFKNLAVEGRIVFDRRELIPAAAECGDRMFDLSAAPAHPFIHFGNIFITPHAGNTALRVAPPANVNFAHIPALPNDENPYQRIRDAQSDGRLGVIGPEWRPIDTREDFSASYAIDMDRDTNGAGLVYFANYVIYMEMAERAAMTTNARSGFTPDEIAQRSLEWRRIAYYGNAAVDDRIQTQVSLFAHPDDARVVGVRCVIHREGDGRLICRSEAVKRLP